MTVNKIYVTFGIVTHSPELGETTSFMEVPFDIPEGAVISYMGLEIEDKENPRTGRATIVRTPFHLDGQQIQPTTEYRVHFIDGETYTHDDRQMKEFEGGASVDDVNLVESRRIIVLDGWSEIK
jgi:hypothetical protein